MYVKTAATFYLFQIHVYNLPCLCQDQVSRTQRHVFKQQNTKHKQFTDLLLVIRQSNSYQTTDTRLNLAK